MLLYGIVHAGPSSKASIIQLIMNIITIVEVAVNLETALDEGGHEIWCPRKVHLAYAKTWLAVDLVGTIPITTIIAAAGNGQGAYTLSQVLTLTMFARLVRYSSKWRSRLLTGLHSVRVLAFLLCAIVLAHFDACIEFYLQANEEFPATGAHIVLLVFILL